MGEFIHDEDNSGGGVREDMCQSGVSDGWRVARHILPASLEDREDGGDKVDAAPRKDADSLPRTDIVLRPEKRGEFIGAGVEFTI